jgi:hypothetical protein
MLILRGRFKRAFIAVATVAAASMVAMSANALPAVADNVTVSYDNLRTGWDPNESALSPPAFQAASFGQLFATQLNGQVYASPISAKGVLFAATENNWIYGLNPVTGAILWSRNVGPAWPASTIGCGDLVPNVGITSTPVYDPSSGTVYFTAKVNDGTDAQHPHWYVHAVDITTGNERPGFPTIISGAPSNNPANPFNPLNQDQRAGLLLLNGVVYAGFASLCDTAPYNGYVAGINASTGQQVTLWSTEEGTASGQGGIWQSGGGLVSDGPNSIFATTGNGSVDGGEPPPGAGHAPPAHLGDSVIHLQVNSNGSLSPVDFFSPSNNATLAAQDTDLGAGGPMAIPDGYGTSAHPHLLVQVGKDGRVFLLDRDNLGGMGQGPGGTDAVLQTAGPIAGVWGHPAFWGGGSGYVYLIGNGGPLTAFRLGVSSAGLPDLTQVGTSLGTFGYTSGSPVVTSNGTAGSALVWAVYASDEAGDGGQLRAYDAMPNSSGTLAQVFSAPIGTAGKFTVPTTDNGRVYVGTRDGYVRGFGAGGATTSSTGAITGIYGKCVDVRGAGTADGTPVQIFTCNGTGAQQWTVTPGPAGDTLQALGKCLDVQDAGTANGTITWLYTCNGTGAQAWAAQPNGELVNPESGRCLTDPGASSTDSTQLSIYDCNSYPDQVWALPSRAAALRTQHPLRPELR